MPGYTYKTNFNSAEFLIDINSSLIIAAKLVKRNNKMNYEFILDTQFLSSKEISLEKIKMINNILDILKNNRIFVLS